MTVLPEVNFVETDPKTIENSIIEAYESLSGRKLYPADPVRIFLLSIAKVIIQQRIFINHTAKQNLLYYAEKESLDHKGYPWRTPRLGAKKSKTTLRLYIAEGAPMFYIEKGFRATPNSELFFETTEEVWVDNKSFVDVEAECVTPGIIGNGFKPGTINMMVKPIPFVERVENITESQGGAEREVDDSYRERIHQAPESLSVAGPGGAYEYWVKTTSSLITDVDVSTPNPGEIDIKFILEDGELPGQEMIDAVYKKVSDKKVRPLTDYVTVGPPDIVNYELDVTYYIPRNAVKQSLIQENVEKAIHDYTIWQKKKIGRDINPSKLISDCIKAGAKRIEVNSPDFTVIERGQLAVASSVSINFGGEEDD